MRAGTIGFVALALAGLTGPVLGQQAQKAQESQQQNAAEKPAGSEKAQEAEAYNPQPFLSAMVKLRSVAITCDSFVANNPAQQTGLVDEFFKSLKLELPALGNTTTYESLNEFIPSQAASLCQDMLNQAFLAYGLAAADYEQQRPKGWPVAPAIANAQWCQTPTCLER